MGVFADIKAAIAIQKIKKGGTTQLSISQITGLLINLTDAQKNLPREDFNRVNELFKEMRKCNTKIQMNFDLYLDTAVKIIKEFDKIAPYEKYSGGNEIEYSFLMADIRGENYEEIRKLRKTISDLEEDLKESEIVYKKNMMILAEAWSDEELSNMVTRGEFPAEQMGVYKENRATLEALVQSEPQVHVMTLKYIETLKKQLQELEQQ